ncbi:collagen alpha-1(I) chain-like [Parus major]|uniref:collagen alpha-1(I) chain-like n=1 Tax=Parus major TaxID=9157 RepID=UPI0014441A44|nr:collagen alpha-1(I) chain-like [Parus major]
MAQRNASAVPCGGETAPGAPSGARPAPGKRRLHRGPRLSAAGPGCRASPVRVPGREAGGPWEGDRHFPGRAGAPGSCIRYCPGPPVPKERGTLPCGPQGGRFPGVAATAAVGPLPPPGRPQPVRPPARPRPPRRPRPPAGPRRRRGCPPERLPGRGVAVRFLARGRGAARRCRALGRGRRRLPRGAWWCGAAGGAGGGRGGPGAPGSCAAAAAGGRIGVSFTSPSSARGCSSAASARPHPAATGPGLAPTPARDTQVPVSAATGPAGQGGAGGARPAANGSGAAWAGGGGAAGESQRSRVRRGGRGALRARCPRGPAAGLGCARRRGREGQAGMPKMAAPSGSVHLAAGRAARLALGLGPPLGPARPCPALPGLRPHPLSPFAALPLWEALLYYPRYRFLSPKSISRPCP